MRIRLVFFGAFGLLAGSAFLFFWTSLQVLDSRQTRQREVEIGTSVVAESLSSGKNKEWTDQKPKRRSGAEINRAFEALVSWPSLPKNVEVVEGTLLVSTGRFSRTQKQRGRVILLFDYDPVEGSKGLRFSLHHNIEKKKEIELELVQRWGQNSLVKSMKNAGPFSKKIARLISSLSTDIHTVLQHANVHLAVGGSSEGGGRLQQQWFLLLPSRCSTPTANMRSAIEWAETDLAALGEETADMEDFHLEWKPVGRSQELFLVTSSHPGVLVAVAAWFNQEVAQIAACGERISIPLVRGFMLWTQGQLEQEIQRELFWPCEEISPLVLAGGDISDLHYFLTKQEDGFGPFDFQKLLHRCRSELQLRNWTHPHSWHLHNTSSRQ